MILLAGLAIMALTAPKPVGADAPEFNFSAARALIHVRAITRTPHPIGSKANVAVREYLVTQLTALGLNPQVLPAIGVYKGTRNIVIGNTNNIVGRLPGTASSRAMVIMAHYDSVDLAPGAGDDAAGVAAILESVRALRAGPSLKNDLIVLFTDGEEAGLLGADAFTASHPWMKDIGLVMNFEGRGNQGPSMLFETSVSNARLIKAVGEAVPHPVGSSLFGALYKLLPNDTDFTMFRPSKTPGLNFAFGANLEAYHSPLDTFENLSPSSLQHHGSYVLGLARHFGQMDLAQFKNSSGDDVFFDWLGSRLVSYTEGWIVPGELLATALLILAILLMSRNSEVQVSRIFVALLPSFAFLFAIPIVLAAGAWLLIRLLARHMITGDSPANAWLLAGLILLGTCTGSLLFAGFRKRFSVQELWLSGLIIVCVLSWTMGLMLPAGSYLLFWPLLLMDLGLLGIALRKKPAQPLALGLASLAGTAMSALLFAPIIYLLYIFLTFRLVTIVAAGLILGLFFLLCAPLMDLAVPQGKWWHTAVVLLTGAIFGLGIGAKLSHYSAEHPQHDSILYSLNADDRTAAWISYDRSLDEWTAQFFSNKPAQRQPMPSYLAGSRRTVLSSSASPLDLAPPTASIESDEKQGDVRKIRLNIRSQRGAEMLAVTFGNDVKLVSLRSGAREIRPSEHSDSFSITLYGMEAKGADLELSFKPSSNVSFWLVDRTDGLPTKVRPRPDNLMADNGSDVTMTCRKYSF